MTFQPSISPKSAYDGKYADITEKIIGGFYQVYNTLGYGFLERVYRNAMSIELAHSGLTVEQEKQILVHYNGLIIGEYYSDLLVNNCVLVELKAAPQLIADHEAQLLNYLKATQIEVGLLLNFGPKPQYKRKIFDNNLKKSLS